MTRYEALTCACMKPSTALLEQAEGNGSELVCHRAALQIAVWEKGLCKAMQDLTIAGTVLCLGSGQRK